MVSNASSVDNNNNSQEVKFIEKMSQHYTHTYGIPRIGGRMLGVLMLSPQAQTIDQLRTRLQASHGSISTNLRLLIVLGLVEKVSLPEERCDFYQFATHIWQRMLLKRLESIERLKQMAEQGLRDLEPEGVVEQRFEELLAWVNIGYQKYLEFLDEWHKLGHESAGGV